MMGLLLLNLYYYYYYYCYYYYYYIVAWSVSGILRQTLCLKPATRLSVPAIVVRLKNTKIYLMDICLAPDWIALSLA